MPQSIRTARYVLASLFILLPALAHAAPYKYGYCQGLAGNPRVNNYTKIYVFGASTPMDASPEFLSYLHTRYKGFVTQEYLCRPFATAAEAQTAYQQMLQEGAAAASTWPLVEVDWVPSGASPSSGGSAAPAPAAAPAAAASKPPAPAAASAPAADATVRLDRWGKPIPTSAWWFCNSYVRKNSYASAPFVANTLDRSPQEMYEQFLDYLNRTYHESGNPTCNRFATQAEAEQRIAQLSAEAPGSGYQFARIDWVYRPGAKQ